VPLVRTRQRPVVRADSWPAICCAISSLPPFWRYVGMPVARKLWQPMRVAIEVTPPLVKYCTLRSEARFAGEDSLRRFRHERQVLVKLDHLSLARLVDGGATNDGPSLPFTSQTVACAIPRTAGGRIVRDNQARADCRWHSGAVRVLGSMERKTGLRLREFCRTKSPKPFRPHPPKHRRDFARVEAVPALRNPEPRRIPSQ
jgi:hypothetical protein